MLVRVTNDDRAKLALISHAQDFCIEGNDRCQLRDVSAIDRTVASQLGQGEIVRVKREKPQASEPSREELGQSFRVSSAAATARCFGACGLAPVAVVDGDVVGRITTDILEDRLRKVLGHAG